ncbi:MAG: HetP family heterocyst commitment protein, partial [Prochloraceae cyanobacterium]
TMNQQFSYSHTRIDKIMTGEQFEQIVSAILDGKYSWACVLILRFTGCNPLHYIPYRTYNRLLKNKYKLSSKKQIDQKSGPKISDLSYLENAQEEYSKVNGGNRKTWITCIKYCLEHRFSNHPSYLSQSTVNQISYFDKHRNL